MAIKGYKITDAVKERLRRARSLIKSKVKNPNALKPNDPRYRKRTKAWRQRNVAKRNAQRARNYRKTRPQIRKHKPWTEWDIGLVLLSGKGTDRLIAESMGRSIQAIQQRRYILKSLNKERT